MTLKGHVFLNVFFIQKEARLIIHVTFPLVLKGVNNHDGLKELTNYLRCKKVTQSFQTKMFTVHSPHKCSTKTENGKNRLGAIELLEGNYIGISTGIKDKF